MRHSVRLLCIVVLAAGSGPVGAQSVKSAAAPDEFLAAAPAEPLPEPLAAGLASLRSHAIASHIRFLASPSMEGRGLGGRGLESALDYIAAQLALTGVPPLPDSAIAAPPPASYFEVVPMREVSASVGQLSIEWRLGSEVRQRTFSARVDCLFPTLPPQNVSAPVVFAGFGIREPSLGRDDYRGIDVRGKVVLLLAGLPSGEAWAKPELQQRYAAEKARPRFAAKIETAQAAGAAAVLAVEGDDWATRIVSAAEAEERAFFPFDEGERKDAPPPLIRLSPAAGNALLAAASLNVGLARSAASRGLPGVTASIHWNATERLITSRNVVGLLAGSDPRLKEEAVILGAHVDHLGQSGGILYPGADDNASGVAALLEIAKSFAQSPRPPRRSLVFAFWTGEEEGKLGSGHFVRHPLWPLAETAVYVNLDMIGHTWSAEEIRDLTVSSGLSDREAFLSGLKPEDFVELGLTDWVPQLGSILRQAGRGFGLALRLDRSDGRSGGSDYREFARAGVPWVRFFGNYFAGYHEASDLPEKLDPGQVEKMARLCFATTYLLANSDTRPGAPR